MGFCRYAVAGWVGKIGLRGNTIRPWPRSGEEVDQRTTMCSLLPSGTLLMQLSMASPIVR